MKKIQNELKTFSRVYLTRYKRRNRKERKGSKEEINAEKRKGRKSL